MQVFKCFYFLKDEIMDDKIQNINKRVNTAADYVKDHINSDEYPDIGIILGSGLSGFENILKKRTEIKYADIPGFLNSTAPGHAGKLIFGNYDGINLMIMSGRFHYYEGYSMQEITIPVRVMAMLGIKRLIITNACGGVNENFKPGELMMIEDQINLSGYNPLIGPNNDSVGPRFPDMTKMYSTSLISNVMKEAAKQNINLHKGVYAFMTGPSYETPAEVRMIRILGGDACGMSSVPEAIVARHAGMEIIGISCITNMAAGIVDKPLDGDEVIEAGKRSMETFSKVVLMSIKA